MTAIALDRLMLTAQRELGVFIVIKGGGCPILGGMTISALGTKRTLVLVILLMARETVLGRFAVLFTEMAISALHVDMLAFKGKAGFIVVKLLCIFPAFFNVAICTGSA